MDSNIPPPPPLPNFKPSLPISKIKASDLQKVKKKTKRNIKRKNKEKVSNHFEPPSLEELQITISRLKNLIK